jgi:ankyrin repeat protein
MMAITMNQIDIAKTLIGAGCDLNTYNEKKRSTALMLSIMYKLPQITTMMIEAGCEIQAKLQHVRIFV